MPQEWTPKSKTAQVVFDVGFTYDPVQNIILSRMDAWQRKFGYAFAYDFAAPATISAIIDCEPFFFTYNGKDWMIELWKGQYGLETGAEIGVYAHVQNGDQNLLDSVLGKRPHDRANGKFFDCVDDEDRLTMSFTLYRNGIPLFSRGPETHWWLTGFLWGILSTPEELMMDISIVFPTGEMCNAFVEALNKSGYQKLVVSGTTVNFKFGKPLAYQPRTDPKCVSIVDQAQKDNSTIVKKYKTLGLPSNDPNLMDETAKEVIAYFESLAVNSFEHGLIAALKSRGVNSKRVREALEEVSRRSAGLWARFMKRLRKAVGRISL